MESAQYWYSILAHLAWHNTDIWLSAILILSLGAMLLPSLGAKVLFSLDAILLPRFYTILILSLVPSSDFELVPELVRIGLSMGQSSGVCRFHLGNRLSATSAFTKIKTKTPKLHIWVCWYTLNFINSINCFFSYYYRYILAA